MAETKIEWADFTFNPWSGCTKVAEGCKFCYAEVNYSIKMRGVKWGPNGNRVLASDSMWGQPVKWNKQAAAAGVRKRVFCASLADVFEDWDGLVHDHKGGELSACSNRCQVPCRWDGVYCPECGQEGSHATLADVRRRLFAMIDATPNLDWLILTKRPENIRRMMFDGDDRITGFQKPPARKNLWLGTSIATQTDADRNIPELLKCRDLSPVLWVSAEPLLENINITRLQDDGRFATPGVDGLDWVVIGGESGPKARPCNVAWIRSLREQCQAAGVSCFIKQLGANIITRNDMVEDVFNDGHSGWPDPVVEHDIHGFRENYQGADCRIRLRDPKGGDWDEFPEDLKVREFPR